MTEKRITLTGCALDVLWRKRTWIGRILFLWCWIALPTALLIDAWDLVKQKTKRS